MSPPTTTPITGQFVPQAFNALSVASLPIYKGRESPMQLSEFLERFEDSALQFNWSESDKLFAIKDKLYGEARALITEFSEDIKTYEDVKKILKKNFESQVPHNVALFDFMSFRQQAEVSVERYFAQAAKKSKLLHFGDCSPESADKQRETLLFGMIMSNLHPQLLRGVIAKSPKNLTELKTAAKLEESAWLAVKGQSNPFVDVVNHQVFQAEAKPDPNSHLIDLCSQLTAQVSLLSEKIDKLEKKNEEGNSNGRNNIKCYRCGKLGHIQRFCRVNLGNQNPEN